MKTVGIAGIAAALLVGCAVFAPLPAADADAGADARKDKPSEKSARKAEPFYRKYLVPGAPLDERIREQEKRIEKNPTSADLHNDFGNLLAARRFPKEARAEYLEAMKLDKENFMAPYNLGILEESEGRVSVAISAYEKSVDRNRGFPPARFRLGRLLEKRGKTHEAIAQYSRALEIDPEMREVRRNPLVADTRLLDRVSVAIYHKDVARVAIKTDTAFADESFRRVPVDRPIYASDLVDPPEPEPVDSTRAPATRAPVGIPPGVRQTRPQDLGTSPAAPPPPPPAPVQPTPVPADPSDVLGLRPRPPLPTPLPQ